MKIINWLEDYYGSEENKNKDALKVGVFFIVFFVLITLAICFYDMDDIERITLIWFGALLFSIALFIFTSYFFFKKQDLDRYKIVKYVTFILSLLLMVITCFPIVLVGVISEKLKLEGIFRHSDKYAVIVCIPLTFGVCIGAFVYYISYAIPFFKSNTLFMLVTFMFWRLGSIAIVEAYYKWGKNRLSEEDYLAIKKDLYVIVFAAITAFTIVANCINFQGVDADMVDGITKAFAIYIAIDRLSGKWKSANNEFNKERERLKEEKTTVIGEKNEVGSI